MSPSLPTIGVAIEADSRNAVRSHEVAVVLAWRSSPIWGSAGMTGACDSANDTPARSSTSSTSVGRAAVAGVGAGVGNGRSLIVQRPTVAAVAPLRDLSERDEVRRAGGARPASGREHGARARLEAR